MHTTSPNGTIEAYSNPDLTANSSTIQVDVAVLGAGPGGYTAAFRAADLGKKVALIERYPNLGGVCLHVGCIPSKTLLHVASVLRDAQELTQFGISFTAPKVDYATLNQGKDKIVKRLSSGLASLAKQRAIQILQGTGRFISPHQIQVSTAEKSYTIAFNSAVIACGSRAIPLTNAPQDPRIMDSTRALILQDIPKELLVIGGGIIGLELATIYHALGSQIDVVELQSQLLPGCDADLVKILHQRIRKDYRRIMTETRVTNITTQGDGIWVNYAGTSAPQEAIRYDKILVAIGRLPNGTTIGAEQAGVQVDDHGYISVDQHCRTTVPHIFAVGDVTGAPMLAHKAIHQGKVAAEVLSGMPANFTPQAIPAVAYTHPEVAWMGLTETLAQTQGTAYETAVFPWAANGRALSLAQQNGFTKLIIDPHSKRVLGAGIVGQNAGDLISETVLAIEFGANAEDLSLIIHPHPTLSETIGLAGEVAVYSVTDILPRNKSSATAK